jgi:hypothetical protein
MHRTHRWPVTTLIARAITADRSPLGFDQGLVA